MSEDSVSELLDEEEDDEDELLDEDDDEDAVGDPSDVPGLDLEHSTPLGRMGRTLCGRGF